MILNTNFNNILTTYQGNKIKMVTKAVTDKTRGAYGDVIYYCSVYVSPISLLDNGQFQYDESQTLLVEETILSSSFTGDEAVLTYRVPFYEFDAKYAFHIYTKDERGNSQSQKTVECIGICNESSSAKVIKGAWNNTKLEVEVAATLGHINPKNKTEYHDSWTAYVSAIKSLLGDISYKWVLYVGQADKTATSETQGHVIKEEAITLTDATQDLHKTYVITHDTATGLELNPESSYCMYAKLEIVDTPISTTEDISLNRECPWSEKLLSEIFTPPWTIRKGTVRAFSPYKWENINTGAMVVNKSSASADATATLALYDTHQTTGGQAANTPNIGFFDDKHNLLGEIKVDDGIATIKAKENSLKLSDRGIELARIKHDGKIRKIRTESFHSDEAGEKFSFYDEEHLDPRVKAMDSTLPYMTLEVAPKRLVLTNPSYNEDISDIENSTEIQINSPFNNNGTFQNAGVIKNSGQIRNSNYLINETSFLNKIPEDHPDFYGGKFENKAPFLNTVGIKAEGLIRVDEGAQINIKQGGGIDSVQSSLNLFGGVLTVEDANTNNFIIQRMSTDSGLTFSTSITNSDFMKNFLLFCEEENGVKNMGLEVEDENSYHYQNLGLLKSASNKASVLFSMTKDLDGSNKENLLHIELTNPSVGKVGYLHNNREYTFATEEYVQSSAIKTKVINGWTIVEYPNKVVQMWKKLKKADCRYVNGAIPLGNWYRYIMTSKLPNNYLASVTGAIADGTEGGGHWHCGQGSELTTSSVELILFTASSQGLNATSFPAEYPTVTVWGIAK